MNQTVCAYCGVGCKFEISNGKLKGVKSYPVNKGLSCAKGMSQIKSIFTNRLLMPQIRSNIKDEFGATNYDHAIKTIAKKIKNTHPQKTAFYLSGQMLNEDYYIANKLAKGFIGTPHCDTNSRTCMASAVVGYKKSFGVDYVPVRIEDIEHANLMIIIGANPAEAHVVLFNKIKKAQKQGMKVIVIDPRETMTAKIADLYLPLRAGSDIDLLNLLCKKLIHNGNIDNDFILKHSNGFNEYKNSLMLLDDNKLLESTGLSQKQFDMFLKLWIKNKNIITAWTMGLNQSVQGVDKNLAVNNLHIITGQINKQGSGPFSLTGQPNAMGGREVGGLSTTLAVHLDYSKENCQKVSKFWNTDKLPSKQGLTAFEMIEAADKGELDVLIICHTDPVYHLPNRHFVETAFKKIALVVEINAYEQSETSKYTHIRIPAVPFGQKEGTQTNLDRTVSRVENFHSKDGLLQDWEIFAKLGRALGYKKAFDFADTKAVFDEYKAMTRLSKNGHLDIYKADYNNLKSKPFVWGKELYKNNRFFTQNKKANLFFIRNKNLSEQPNEKYPFILLTGRTRDQWHTGSKTAQVDTLLHHKPIEFVEMNSADALELDINENDTVWAISKRGKLKVQVIFANINRKTIFIPVSHKEINYLTDDKLDPLSKEPDYNHSGVRIEKIV
ncbi:MAG: nitrate reductase [Epsilonproteobacteria bacterium (ex Lamellibrachia satsuma)]|nr:MAG: nitrate reductase [Epsilonproteobacteria bacterium (ex Lamellibrachia satsuma)]